MGAGTMPRRRWWRLAVLTAAVASALVLSAGPAAAKLDDPCTASGVIDGKTYDPKVSDEFDGLPRKGDVVWEGAVPEGDGSPRPTQGEVKVKLPGGIGEVTVGSWSNPEDTKYRNSDVYEYDLPAVVEGIPIPITGFHQEPGIRCEGSVTVTIGDGGFGNPATIPALVLTALSAGLLVVSVKAGG